jgi:hypothetical protein
MLRGSLFKPSSPLVEAARSAELGEGSSGQFG